MDQKKLLTDMSKIYMQERVNLDEYLELIPNNLTLSCQIAGANGQTDTATLLVSDDMRIDIREVIQERIITLDADVTELSEQLEKFKEESDNDPDPHQ